MNYLDELNPEQRAAVEETEGPSIIIAGAGSGKTRVLTYRIAHLLESGVSPFNILALTFTNKAATEMKNRIMSIAGSDAKSLWMGTFHSVFSKILRVECEKINYPSNFTIYDTSDSKNLIKSIIKDENVDEKTYTPNVVLGRISTAKTNLISWQSYQNNEEFRSKDKASKKPLLGHLYEVYSKRCFRASAMDFDDLLFNTYQLLTQFPDILLKYQTRFRYILVDEYQDTNYAQYMILKYLAALHENISVVGDDAQSIYAFRGANIQNILSFRKDYPESKIFKLEQNYRSTKNIVEAANSVIKRNINQIHKKIWTDNETGEKIKVVRAMSDIDEAATISNMIFDTTMNNRLKYTESAILYRTNAQSRAFEEALRRLNIPYKIYGGLSFYQRKEIKDLLAYFRLAVNHNDEDALTRIINYPIRGIGQTSVDKIFIKSNLENVGIWHILENINNIEIDLNNGTRKKIADFVLLIQSFKALIESKDAYTAAQTIAERSGLLKHLKDDSTPEGVSRVQNIEELLNAINEFVDDNTTEDSEPIHLDVFMQDIALLTNDDKKTDDEKAESVSLMTVHSAKGLEYPYVYIVGVEENLFPSQMALNTVDELEEERRLFYVAVTRAEKKLTISYATSRYRWGNLEMSEPSRFISELDKNYLDLPEVPVKKPVISSWNPLKQNTNPISKPQENPLRKLKKIETVAGESEKESHYFSQEKMYEIQAGMNVMHERFGKGKVLNVEGKNTEKKATIFFEGSGQKILLLKFAKLKVLE